MMKTNIDINKTTDTNRAFNSSEYLLITLAKRLAAIANKIVHIKKTHMNLLDGITNFSTASKDSLIIFKPPYDVSSTSLPKV